MGRVVAGAAIGTIERRGEEQATAAHRSPLIHWEEGRVEEVAAVVDAVRTSSPRPSPPS
jgi:hypothetical protein